MNDTDIVKQAEKIARERDEWHKARETVKRRGWNPHANTPAKRQRNRSIIEQILYENRIPKALRPNPEDEG